MSAPKDHEPTPLPLPGAAEPPRRPQPEKLDDDPYGGDELLRACVEQAMAPHLCRLSPEKLEVLRDTLIDFVTTHPAAEPLYARLKSRPEAVQSTLLSRAKQKNAAAQNAASAQDDAGPLHGLAPRKLGRP